MKTIHRRLLWPALGLAASFSIAHAQTSSSSSTVREERTVSTPSGSSTTTKTSETMPDGTTKTTNERTVTDPTTGSQLRSTTTTYTVKALDPGKSVTLIGADGNATTYVIAPQSDVPTDVVVGRKVTIDTVPGSSSEIRTIHTYRESTSTTAQP